MNLTKGGPDDNYAQRVLERLTSPRLTLRGPDPDRLRQMFQEPLP